MTNYASLLLNDARRIMKGYEAWSGELVRCAVFGRDQWRVYCGDGRFDPGRNNAAYSKKTCVALNFQVVGHSSEPENYEFCRAWPSAGEHAGWQLMFHFDPDRAAWPGHSAHHIQMTVGELPTPPPFASWRIPIDRTKPIEILEFIQAHVA